MTNTTTTITTSPIVSGLKAGTEAALKEAAFMAVPCGIAVGISAAIGGKKMAIEAAKHSALIIGLFSAVEFVWEGKDAYEAKKAIITHETIYDFEVEEDE